MRPPSVLFSYRLAGCVVPGAWLALLSLPVVGERCLWVYWSALHLGEPSLRCRWHRVSVLPLLPTPGPVLKRNQEQFYPLPRYEQSQYQLLWFFPHTPLMGLH